jgi:hypothetical protein
MKLRFRGNSLRLRVNRKEVARLAAAEELVEEVRFGNETLGYSLKADATCTAEFDGKRIRVTAPLTEWASADEIGFYFEAARGLKVAIEKDLECVDGPEEEKDPYAFPRSEKVC